MYPYTYIDSSLVSDYYPILCEMGYPQLDVIRYNDGEWSVIEYLNAPLVPSLTKYRHIALNIRHLEINESNLKKIILECDTTKKRIWEREEQNTKKIFDEHKTYEENREYIIEEAVNVIKRNPDLMERVAKKGLSEIDLPNIAKNIDPEKIKKRLREKVK